MVWESGDHDGDVGSCFGLFYAFLNVCLVFFWEKYRKFGIGECFWEWVHTSHAVLMVTSLRLLNMYEAWTSLLTMLKKF